MFLFFVCFISAAKTRCMKALPHCDVPRAICANKTKNGKMKFFCYCKSGFTGENSNCIGKDNYLH